MSEENQPGSHKRSRLLSEDLAVRSIAELIQGGQFAAANQAADDALASFPGDWRLHQQKARALEQMPRGASSALATPVLNLDAAKHYFAAAQLAAATHEFRARAPSLISMGRAQLEAADTVAAQCFSNLLPAGSESPALARPLLVSLSTLPKSASAYLWMSLSSGLGLVPARVSTWKWGPDSFTEIIDVGRLDALIAKGGCVVHGHFAPDGVSDHAINKLDKVLVHVRDPRQTVMSWAHFLAEGGYVDKLLHNSYSRVLSHLSLEDRIDWAVDMYLPNQVEYLRVWMDGVKSGRITATVKFVRHEDLAADAKGYFDSILDFYSFDRRMFTYPQSAEVGKLHFRSGKTDEWRESLSAAQADRVQRKVSDDLLDFYGWQR